jgi:hypothetical protein
MAASTTQLSLKLMRKQGFYAEVVERYNYFTKRKNDFAGFIDILCLKEGLIVGVQTTTSGNALARTKKIVGHENFLVVKQSGIKIEVHGWKKENNRWQVTVIDIE